jgi:CxxC-x17-CxxC domain-containing protein
MESSRKGGFGKGGNGGGFRKSGGFSDRKSFSKPSFGGDYNKKPWDKGGKSFNNDNREMFQATCSGCGKSCQVPFRPSSGKPVFCDDCFAKQRNDGPSRGDSRPSYNDRADRGARPAPVVSSANNDVLARQIQAISGKLDTLIDLMSKQSQPAKQTSTPVVAAAKKEVVPNIELKAAVKKAVKVAKAAPAAKTPAKKVVAKKVAKTAKKK